MVTPAPRKKVRRDKCFLLINIFFNLPLMSSARYPGWNSGSRWILNLHLKGGAFDNVKYDRRKAVVFRCRRLQDFANCGHVVVLYAPAQCIRQQFFSEDPGENFGLVPQGLA